MPPNGVSKAAVALRDSFGDRNIPDISRKITACVACRKLKIKCNIMDASEPCTRCKARGLSCTVNKSLQMLLESDVTWKEAIEQRISSLEESLVAHEAPDRAVISEPEMPDTATAKKSVMIDSGITDSAALHDSTALDLSINLGAFPATSSDQRATGGNSNVSSGSTLVSAGILTERSIEQFFNYFRQNLNPQLHYAVVGTDTLAEVQSRSSLLLTAVCTVAAFCLGSEDYAKCMQSLQSRVSSILFRATYSFDDVRALCIASFWLDDSSAVFNGLAVRISTQLNLHRCITKVNAKEACYDRTRLYYLVYLCDHHCSLKHGRPPMTQEWRSLRPPAAFLQSQHSRNVDLMLISQVELWSISRRVFETFGADVESDAAAARLSDFQDLDAAYQQWWSHWIETMALGVTVGNRSMCELYFHAAKLYLYSHVFRGPGQSSGISDSAILVQNALSSAVAIMSIAARWERKPSNMTTWPTYHGTMVAYASVYLLKTLRNDVASHEMQRADNLLLLQQLTHKLAALTFVDSSSHPLRNLRDSLEAALASLAPPSVSQTAANLDLPFDSTLLTDDFWNMDFTTLDDTWEHSLDH